MKERGKIRRKYGWRRREERSVSLTNIRGKIKCWIRSIPAWNFMNFAWEGLAWDLRGRALPIGGYVERLNSKCNFSWKDVERAVLFHFVSKTDKMSFYFSTCYALYYLLPFHRSSFITSWEPGAVTGATHRGRKGTLPPTFREALVRCGVTRTVVCFNETRWMLTYR